MCSRVVVPKRLGHEEPVNMGISHWVSEGERRIAEGQVSWETEPRAAQHPASPDRAGQRFGFSTLRQRADGRAGARWTTAHRRLFFGSVLMTEAVRATVRGRCGRFRIVFT